MTPKIIIEVIPHDQHRYETVGDWFTDADGIIHVRVSDMNNSKYEMLVAIHELIEMVLCEWAEVTEKQVDEFDMIYENGREQGVRDEFSEPGFDEDAPYRIQHTFASSVELGMCAIGGLSWNDYEAAINAL